MFKSNALKWCLLVVACLTLFAYQMNNNRKAASKFDRSLELDLSNQNATAIPLNESRSYDETVKVVPTADENLLSIEYVSNRIPEAPLISDFEVESELDSMEEPGALFEFEDNETIGSADKLPADLPRPAKVDNDDEVTVSETPRKVLQGPISLTDGVQIKVVQHIEYGKSLARRGAVFGAKNEFHSALRLIAQAVDFQYRSKEYSNCLFNALMAIDEADDFYYAQNENNGRVDVAAIGMRHNSKILTRRELESLTPVDAMQAYYNYVQENFVRCSGKTVVAGEALYCLGKLYLLKGKNVVEGTPLDNAKAIVHHRAAIECDARNYKSANELAVLLVKSGRFEQAKRLLIHSLKVKQVPAAWENLAFVHKQLGEPRLASLAQAEFQRMLGAPPSTHQIKWVSPEEFVAGSVDPVELRTADASTSSIQKKGDGKPAKFKNILNRLF